jgi:hypothetical protein
VTVLILNQYRHGSDYKDVVGKLYHFPCRYLKTFTNLPLPFIYYEPRQGGDQVYFGQGTILSVYEDTEDVGHAYAEIGGYQEFPSLVDFYSAQFGTWENPKTMRNSVRRLAVERFEAILKAAGVKSATEVQQADSFSAVLQRELESYPGPGKRSLPVLRRIKRILETYERPSSVTNHVKRSRGSNCQLCGLEGFLKRDGKRYCEVHHLFHLAEEPPADCLSPEYLVVLCANCHRRMHYAKVNLPIASADGWTVEIDGGKVSFRTQLF